MAIFESPPPSPSQVLFENLKILMGSSGVPRGWMDASKKICQTKKLFKKNFPPPTKILVTPLM